MKAVLIGLHSMGRDCEGSDCVSTQHVKTKKKGRRMAEKFKSHSLGWLRTCSQLSDVLTILWPSEQQGLIDWTMFCLSFGFVCFECWLFLLSCAVAEGWNKRQQLTFVRMAQTRMKNNGWISKDVGCSKKRVDWVWCWAKMIGRCVRFQRPYI